MNEKNPSEGGVLIPSEVAPIQGVQPEQVWDEIIKNSPILQRVRVVNVRAPVIRHVEYDEEDVYDYMARWVNELEQKPKQVPQLHSAVLQLNKIVFMAPATDELLGDAQQLLSFIRFVAARKFAQSIDRQILLGDSAFSMGGIANTADHGTVVQAISNPITMAEILTYVELLTPDANPKFTAWVVSKTRYRQILNLAGVTANQKYFEWSDYGSLRLCGYPVYQSPIMTEPVSVVLGDWSMYTVYKHSSSPTQVLAERISTDETFVKIIARLNGGCGYTHTLADDATRVTGFFVVPQKSSSGSVSV